MVQDEFAGLISSYACASGRDVIQRLRTQFLDLQEPVQRRLLSAIQDLIRVKDALISQCAGLDSLSYPVDGGLGAMCITCVEKHVTSILAEYRFPSEISCRQFWPSFCADEVRRPPIHAYSTVELGGVPLIIDMDADPFVGKSIGVVLAPIDADIPFCHEVPLVLVCPMYSGTRDRVYQLKFTGVHDFSVRRQVDRGAVINVVLSCSVSIELRLSGDGCLVENDWISFVEAPQAPLGAFRTSLSSRSFVRGPVELPKPSSQ